MTQHTDGGWQTTSAGWLIPAQGLGSAGEHGPHAHYFARDGHSMPLLLIPAFYVLMLAMIASAAMRMSGSPLDMPASELAKYVLAIGGGGALSAWCAHTALRPRGAFVIDPVAGYLDFDADMASGAKARRAAQTIPLPAHRARIAFADLRLVERRTTSVRTYARPYLHFEDAFGTVDFGHDAFEVQQALALLSGGGTWLRG